MYPKLATLLQFYESRRNGSRIPPRRAFVPEEMRDWLGHLAILAIERDPVRFRIALSGTAIDGYVGGDFTGGYLDQVVPPRARDMVLALYCDALESSRPVYAVSVPGDTSAGKLHRLILPCADDGQTVNRFIVGAYWERPSNQFGPPRTLYDGSLSDAERYSIRRAS